MTESPRQSPYLSDIPLADAIAAWEAALAAHGLLSPRGSETIGLAGAVGRVTALPVWARLSSPHYHASAMDGYAVRAEDTLGATESRPRLLALEAQAVPVDTGDPIPPGRNAVIPIEHAQLTGESGGLQHIEILAAVPPWQYVRAMGEDMVASELVLPANHPIRPPDLGALAGCGVTAVSVFRRPRVAVIPTGTELVAPGTAVKAGDIIEYNSLVLGGMAEECGATVTRFPIQPDDYERIKAVVAEAMRDHDLIVINAGSSRGREDFTARIVADLGQLCVHGIAIRPGHPVILGVGGQCALAGIPGYPVSAAVTFDLLCAPLLHRWLGRLPPERARMAATLTRKIVSPMGDDEFVRVVLGEVGSRVLATPLAGGAGVITSLVKADGMLRVPRFKEGFHAGEQVDIELLCEPRKVRNTILAIGSHDMTLDVLANALHQSSPGWHLASAHVGSLGGLLALQRDEAHLAGAHLLDEESGEYNVGWVRKTLADHGVPSVLLGFVNRVQGLMVQAGNPKHIRALEDFVRSDVTIVNRQRGAGTRALLDFQLKQRGLDARRIQGYERQEYTHLNVAAAVASGACDCGLGILAAARALGLEFIPLFDERYDLVIPARHYEGARLAPLLEIIRSPNFAREVERLGGYQTARMGQVLAEI